MSHPSPELASETQLDAQKLPKKPQEHEQISLSDSRSLSEYRGKQTKEEDKSNLSSGVYPSLNLVDGSTARHAQSRSATDGGHSKPLAGDTQSGSVTEGGGRKGLDRPLPIVTEEPNNSAAANRNRLSNDEFARVASGVVVRIDSSGAVTKEQVVQAMQNPAFLGKDAQAVAALYMNFDRLAALSPSTSSSAASIGSAHLAAFDQLQERYSQKKLEAKEMSLWAQENFSGLDSDGNGGVTLQEVDSALCRPGLSEADSLALSRIRKNYDELSPLGQSEINEDSFDKYSTKVNEANEFDLCRAVSGCTAHVASDSVGSRALFGLGEGKEEQSVSPEAIRQGTISNCYFLSSLASVAQTNPNLIRDSIRDNRDGTYTVTFPGAKDEPITVKAPTVAEQGLFNGASEFGTWASVMEKAYGEYANRSPLRRSLLNLDGGATPAEGGDGGGFNSGAMELLTGKGTKTDYTLLTSQAKVAKDLESAFSAHPPRAVTTGVLRTVSAETADGFSTAHAYSILGFKADGNGGGMVTVRNPQGGEVGKPTGTITIPLDKFMKNFSFVSYQQA